MRTLTMLLAGTALVMAAVSGCGSKRTYNTPEGEVTVTEEGSKVTIESKDGTLEVEHDNQSGTIRTGGGEASIEIDQGASEKEIGIPFYPGAKATHSATMDQKDTGTFKQVLLTTPDSVDDVKAFYQKKFPKALAAVDAQTAEGRMVHLALQEGAEQTMIQIMRETDKAETNILLHKGKTSE